MFLQTLVVGEMMANCYLLGDDEAKEAIIIDPGWDEDTILSALKERGYHLLKIINTHGHIDHIGANQPVAKATGAKILIHEKDSPMLIDPLLNLSGFFGCEITSPREDIALKGGEVIDLDWIRLEVVHTPGHTLGGICLLSDNFIFTGDTLFAGGIGRTDLAGGSYKTLMDSIAKKLLVLDEAMIIYPGHGLPSTIGQEKRTNPFCFLSNIGKISAILGELL